MENNYIGLMSGTSFDGVDAVLVRFNQDRFTILAHEHLSYPQEIKKALFHLSHPQEQHHVHDIFQLDAQLGLLYAQIVNKLLSTQQLAPDQIQAIGLHGQTICHAPDAAPGYTTQLGDPNILVAQTNITTVADFRRRDIALGGQGAPLAPAFHRYYFYSDDENRAVLNIGGFANVTLLPRKGKAIGFDTGPGNCYLDAMAEKYIHQPYDNEGKWAASGTVDPRLLSDLLSHPFFAKHPPKSTGRDEFSLQWLNTVLANHHAVSPENIQTTLAELTALSVAQALSTHAIDTLYICGGGANNRYLVSRIATHLPGITVTTTQTLGIDPQHMESALIAWLAYCNMIKLPIDLSDITGSKAPALLGAVYFA